MSFSLTQNKHVHSYKKRHAKPCELKCCPAQIMIRMSSGKWTNPLMIFFQMLKTTSEVGNVLVFKTINDAFMVVLKFIHTWQRPLEGTALRQVFEKARSL